MSNENKNKNENIYNLLMYIYDKNCIICCFTYLLQILIFNYFIVNHYTDFIISIRTK